jgi:voltage-gated potassium channel
MNSRYRRARAYIYRQVIPEARSKGLSAFNYLLLLTVLSAVMVQICETEPLLAQPYAHWFRTADILVGTLFLLDMVLRVWAIGEIDLYAGFRGRLRYLVRPRTLVDLLAVIPFLAAPWLSFVNANDLAFLRLLTAIEILVNARLGRFSEALNAMRYAIVSRREELVLGLVLALGVMTCSSVGLYLVEGGVQPDAFGSIPRALWWSLETLTTVGYGDVFPQSVLGRLFAGLFALAGIGIVAIPTGILAAAFNESFAVHRSAGVAQSRSFSSTPASCVSDPAPQEKLST